MNEIIVYNEFDNLEKANIYLYKDTLTESWSAYGYSAYKVKEIAVKDDLNTIQIFSNEMMMPVVLLNSATLKKILINCSSLPCTSADLCLSVHNIRPVNQDDYRIWTNSLRVHI